MLGKRRMFGVTQVRDVEDEDRAMIGYQQTTRLWDNEAGIVDFWMEVWQLKRNVDRGVEISTDRVCLREDVTR